MSENQEAVKTEESKPAPAYRYVVSVRFKMCIRDRDEDEQQCHGESTLKLFNRNRDLFQNLRQHGFCLSVRSEA